MVADPGLSPSDKDVADMIGSNGAVVINLRGIKCEATLLHEIGHAVGLNDDSSGDTFMKQGCGNWKKTITKKQAESLSKANF